MDEKEIDYVLADDLHENDMIMVDGKTITVVERLNDFSDADGEWIQVRGDDDQNHAFIWDTMVTLYGY